MLIAMLDNDWGGQYGEWKKELYNQWVMGILRAQYIDNL